MHYTFYFLYYLWSEPGEFSNCAQRRHLPTGYVRALRETRPIFSEGQAMCFQFYILYRYEKRIPKGNRQ